MSKDFIEDHNLPLPDQTFSDPRMTELVLRARLDELKWLQEFAPRLYFSRRAGLIERIREAQNEQ